MTKTITSTNPRLRAAAYCRIANGSETAFALAVDSSNASV